MRAPRILIIGLDGATLDIIKPLALAGDLPTLSRIMAQGVHGPLRAWPNRNSEAGWSSLITGCNPGQHGIYRLVRRTRLEDQWGLVTAADRRKDPFWRSLSAAGQHVGIINVPLSYPVDQVNGFMLSGMHTPDVRSPGFSHPPDLWDELRRQGIDYVIDLPNLPDLCYRDPQRALREAARMVDMRSRTVLYLMRTHPWDVLLAVFTVTDILQHFFWPDERAPIRSDSWAPLRSIYQQIDSFFGDAMRLIDEHTRVFVVSDHGFGPVRPAKRCLNPLFAHLGLLRYRQGGRQPRGWLLKNLLHYGRQVAPHHIQKPLARAFPRLHGRALRVSHLERIDWSHTFAYAGEYGSRININLEGREAEGVVSAEDYHPTRELVRDILLNLIDPTTGGSVVQAVHRREDVYHGPYAEQAADLLIEWDNNVLRDSLGYRVAGKSLTAQSPERHGRDKRVSGLHRSEGIFVARGPHIRRGATVANACIYDIAPTILYLQDHPIPRGVDGDVLTDIFSEEQLRRYPVRHGEPTEVGVRATEAGLDAEETHRIEELLGGSGVH